MDLNKLETMLDEALEKETKESLTEWMNNRRMKELQEEFYGRGQVKGFHFLQIFKSDYAYIYRKTCIETGNISYEVFKRVENTQFNCISYPRSNSFGVWAYDCESLAKAIEYYDKFNLKEKEDGNYR